MPKLSLAAAEKLLRLRRKGRRRRTRAAQGKRAASWCARRAPWRRCGLSRGLQGQHGSVRWRANWASFGQQDLPPPTAPAPATEVVKTREAGLHSKAGKHRAWVRTAIAFRPCTHKRFPGLFKALALLRPPADVAPPLPLAGFLFFLKKEVPRVVRMWPAS